jgi:ubiquinone/menaquinone biosynthesis C-methylase UbiE
LPSRRSISPPAPACSSAPCEPCSGGTGAIATDPSDAEAERVRAVYAQRAARGLDARYEYWQPANLYIYQSRERAVLALLRASGLLKLTGRRILDAGCGSGAVLHDLVRFGAQPRDCHGIDLLPERIASARALLPDARLDVGDARNLPYEDAHFDLVLAFTLFSSVLDGAVRSRIATELARVTRPGGMILIYDFWTNPTNRSARPLHRNDVRSFFPDHEVAFRSVTLAPPLVRLLTMAPGGWIACTALEMLPFLRTHFLAAVRL